VCDALDNCPSIANSGQENSDGDTFGNVCDNCPNNTNQDQADADQDGRGNVCDVCPNNPTGWDTGCDNLKVQVSDLSGNNGYIREKFNIVNFGTTSVPYNQLTIRYWFTSDAVNPINQGLICWYAVIGNTNITNQSNPPSAAFTYLNTNATTYADYYVVVGFSNSNSLAAGASSGELQIGTWKPSFPNYTWTNDYSYLQSAAWIDNAQVTLYRNGNLIWGNEPCPSSFGAGDLINCPAY
jgi:mannan endo-1,4-beta-mannosidase